MPGARAGDRHRDGRGRPLRRRVPPLSRWGSDSSCSSFRTAIERVAAADGAAGRRARRSVRPPDPPPPIRPRKRPVSRSATAHGDRRSRPEVSRPRPVHPPEAMGATELSGRWPLGSGVGHSDMLGLGRIDPQVIAAVRGPRQEKRRDRRDLGLCSACGRRKLDDVVADGVPVPVLPRGRSGRRLPGCRGAAPTHSRSSASWPLAVASVCTGIAAGRSRTSSSSPAPASRPAARVRWRRGR